MNTASKIHKTRYMEELMKKRYFVAGVVAAVALSAGAIIKGLIPKMQGNERNKPSTAEHPVKEPDSHHSVPDWDLDCIGCMDQDECPYFVGVCSVDMEDL